MADDPFINLISGVRQIMQTISSEISSDVWAYVNNYCTEAVLGQIDVDATWDDYLAELDRMGYNKMMDELERWNRWMTLSPAMESKSGSY